MYILRTDTFNFSFHSLEARIDLSFSSKIKFVAFVQLGV